MRKSSRNLRLVSSDDPAKIFDDLEALRAQNKNSAPYRRRRLEETFARIPHYRALALYRHVGGRAWVVLVELDRIIFKSRGRNPIELPSRNLKAAGLSAFDKRRALELLSAAGVISVQHRPGKAPLVTHSWFPLQE